MKEWFDKENILHIIRGITYVRKGDKDEKLVHNPDVSDTAFEPGFRYMAEVIEFAIEAFPNLDIEELLGKVKIIFKKIEGHLEGVHDIVAGKVIIHNNEHYTIEIPDKVTAQIVMSSGNPEWNNFALSFIASFAHEFRHIIEHFEQNKNQTQDFKWGSYGFEKMLFHQQLQKDVDPELPLFLKLAYRFWELYGTYIYYRSREERIADGFAQDILKLKLSERFDKEDINTFVQKLRMESYRETTDLFHDTLSEFVSNTNRILRIEMINLLPTLKATNNLEDIILALHAHVFTEKEKAYLIGLLNLVSAEINQVLNELTLTPIPEEIIPDEELKACIDLIDSEIAIINLLKEEISA